MRRPRIGLAWQFALVSALILVVVGVGTAIVTARILGAVVTNKALEQSAGEATDIVTSRVLDRLRPEDLQGPMTGERYLEFHRFMSDSVLSQRTPFVKVWNKDGTLIYSENALEMGQRYPTGVDELWKAVAGHTVAVVGEMETRGHDDERLLEVYAPITFPGSSESAGAFEIYQSYEPVAHLVAGIRKSVYLATAGGFTVMYVALLLVIRGGANIIGRQQRELRRHSAELRQSHQETLLAMGRALDLRDAETQHHSLRVQQISLAIARRMGMPPAELPTLETAALLHDVGKIGVPDRILRKPGPLSAREWKTMKKHPELGYYLLKDSRFLRSAAEIVYAHHERFDGTGYPRGLAGEDIPLCARVFAVADAYEAMTSDRPYRKALSHQDAVEEIRRNAGTQFDPQVVKAFFQAVSEEPWTFAGRRSETNLAQAA